MKKLVYLFIAGMMLNNLYASIEKRPTWRFMDEPVKMVVRGIDFYIFPNGDFDFNTHTQHNPHYYTSGEYGVRIEKDKMGKIRRIGNVFINYNMYGQVKRIGHLFIHYNFKGFVKKIGHLKLRYAGKRYMIIKKHRPVYNQFAFYYGPATGYYGNGFSSYNSYSSYVNTYPEDYWTDDDPQEDNDYYFRGGKTQPKKKYIKKKRH